MNKSTILLLIVCFSAVTIVLVPFTGMETIPFETVFKAGSGDIKADIFWKIRIPRVAMAFFTGAVLYAFLPFLMVMTPVSTAYGRIPMPLSSQFWRYSLGWFIAYNMSMPM